MNENIRKIYRKEMNFRTFPKLCVRYIPITFRKPEHDRDKCTTTFSTCRNRWNDVLQNWKKMAGGGNGKLPVTRRCCWSWEKLVTGGRGPWGRKSEDANFGIKIGARKKTEECWQAGALTGTRIARGLSQQLFGFYRKGNGSGSTR